MKKTLLGILTLILTLSLFSCDSYNAKKVKLIGYEDIDYGDKTFYELLEGYAKEQLEEEFDEDAENTYEITISKNWDGADKDELNEKALNKDEAAVTYTIKFDSKSDKDHERVTVKFFTLIYKEDETLKVKGLYLDYNGYVDELYDKWDVEATIAEKIFHEDWR